MQKLVKEFKEFIAGGNMIEFAVAVILAGAVGAVIAAFTEGVMMQIVAAIFGKPDFNSLSFGLGKADIMYGTVITAFINLVLVGLVLFAIIKAYNSMREQSPEETGPSEVDLLTEIRDALRARS
ncbi:MAG: large conductance mechanosensitive channel protein MscL [Ilumatobacteraceae bacterium]